MMYPDQEGRLDLYVRNNRDAIAASISDGDGAMLSEISLTGSWDGIDEERKAYISDISGIDNISHSGMKILLELFKDASFRTIRQAAMDARRTAAFESVPVTFPMLAQAALPYIGIEDSRDGKANDAIRRKARILRERNPRVFSVQALADIFGKPKATMHYMLTN